jgi:2-methylcitrate dehydratase
MGVAMEGMTRQAGAGSSELASDKTSVAVAIARSISGSAIATLERPVLDYARLLILSCLGAMAGGSKVASGAIVTSYVKDRGGNAEATVAGTSLRTTAEMAALANGTFAHATEYEDDSFPEAVTTFTVVPPLLALGEAKKIDFDRFVRAVVVGQEIQSRIGRAYLPALERGIQLLPALGTLATAGSAAYLLGLSADQTANALCIAASQASGLRLQSGSMTHFLESGVAGRAGIMSAVLAAHGFDAEPWVFEGRPEGGPPGYLEFISGMPLQASIKEPWTAPWRTMDVSIKEFPMCTLLTPVVEAAEAIRGDQNFDLDKVASVEVVGNSRLLDHCSYPLPTNPTEAAFSAVHVAALALVHGGDVSLSSFEEPLLSDPKVIALRLRTRLNVRKDWPSAFFSTPLGLIVTDKKGTRTERFIEGSNGMPPRYLSKSAVIHKFQTAADGVLSNAALAQIQELVLESRKLADVGEIARLMAKEGAAGQPA